MSKPETNRVFNDEARQEFNNYSIEGKKEFLKKYFIEFDERIDQSLIFLESNIQEYNKYKKDMIKSYKRNLITEKPIEDFLKSYDEDIEVAETVKKGLNTMKTNLKKVSSFDIAEQDQLDKAFLYFKKFESDLDRVDANIQGNEKVLTTYNERKSNLDKEISERQNNIHNLRKNNEQRQRFDKYSLVEKIKYINDCFTEFDKRIDGLRNPLSLNIAKYKKYKNNIEREYKRNLITENPIEDFLKSYDKDIVAAEKVMNVLNAMKTSLKKASSFDIAEPEQLDNAFHYFEVLEEGLDKADANIQSQEKVLTTFKERKSNLDIEISKKKNKIHNRRKNNIHNRRKNNIQSRGQNNLQSQRQNNVQRRKRPLVNLDGEHVSSSSDKIITKSRKGKEHYNDNGKTLINVGNNIPSTSDINNGRGKPNDTSFLTHSEIYRDMHGRSMNGEETKVRGQILENFLNTSNRQSPENQLQVVQPNLLNNQVYNSSKEDNQKKQSAWRNITKPLTSPVKLYKKIFNKHKN